MSKKPFLWWQKKPKEADVLIRGQKVILRKKHLDDASDDYRWRADHELSSLDDTKPLTMPYPEFLGLYSEELRHSSPWSRRLSIDTLEGKHIGNCMYYDLDYLRRQTELGIMIGEKEYWSQGYGTDAVATLVEHIFKTTSLKRVYLHTLEWNTRARRAFEKAGFKDVKRVTRNGQPFIVMETWRDGRGEPGRGNSDQEGGG